MKGRQGGLGAFNRTKLSLDNEEER